MSHKLTKEAWQVRSLGRAERIVLVRLCDYVRHDSKDNTAWPSIASLAADTGYTPRWVKTALGNLRDAGLIRPVENLKGGRGLPVTYEVLPDGIKGEVKAPFEETERVKWLPEKGEVNSVKGEVSSIPPTPPYKDKPERTGNEPGYTPDEIAALPALGEPAIPPEQDFKDPEPLFALEAEERPPDHAAEFEALWRGWVPIETAKGSKQDGLKAFVKARKGTDYETIMHGCQRYLEHCHATNCRTSHVARWLDKRRWADELPARRSGSPAGGTGYERGLVAAVERARRVEAAGDVWLQD